MEHHTAESREPRGVEEAGCKISSGAPTVSQTLGYVKVKEVVSTVGAVWRVVYHIQPNYGIP